MMRLVKFWQRPPAERRLCFEALIVLLIVQVALKLFPLQRVLAWQTSDSSKKSEVSLSQIAWAVRTAGRYLPGGGNCLVQALTGQFMLARRGYNSQIQIGAAREDGEFKAHAWVECEGKIVIGAAGGSQYTPFPNLEFFQR